MYTKEYDRCIEAMINYSIAYTSVSTDEHRATLTKYMNLVKEEMERYQRLQSIYDGASFIDKLLIRYRRYCSD